MKIIHTSDLHLSSPLTSRLSRTAARARRRELRETFIRLTEAAESLGASAVIIAGDLFDSERVTERELSAFLMALERKPGIKFYYLPGNHEGDIILSAEYALPQNLFIFGSALTEFRQEDLRIIGRSSTEPGMLDSLQLDKTTKNILVLHGELRDKSESGGIIGKADLTSRGIDYVALGHYHSYFDTEFEPGAHAVYSGAPEGRGFDECGDMGFVLIDTDDKITHKFIPFAKRRILQISLDISSAKSTKDIEVLIKDKLAEISADDIIRVLLIGARYPECKIDIEYLTDIYKSSFYHFEIKDKSRLKISADDYRYDKSLKGEFIRLCLSLDIDEAKREKIIECGLSALAGESTEG